MIFIFLLETLIVFQCIQVVFMRTIKVDKYVVGMILIDIVVYTLINRGMIPSLCSIIVYILIYLFCHYRFKQKFIQTIIRVIVSISLVGCIEGASAFILHILSKKDNSIKALLFSSILALVLISVIKKCIFLLGNRKTKSKSSWHFAVVIFYGVMFSKLLIDYYRKESVISIYVLFASTFLIFIFYYLHTLEKAQGEIEKRNYEISLQKVYGETYESLLSDVRRKQHDYKNQLGAMFGMHLTAKSLDELISMQKQYGNHLQLNDKFDSILTCCNNPVLAGFLYYRCVSCENDGVIVDYSIHVDQAECCFALHEMIEILGILIDNACENVILDASLKQCMRLEFQEKEDKIIISVSNPAQYISFSDIDKMFVKGYSSKGENRGIGLARVLELVHKYEAEVGVHNFNPSNEENWICFNIEIHK